MKYVLLVATACMAVAGCQNDETAGRSSEAPSASVFSSRYSALPHETTLLRNATVLTGTGEQLDAADVLMQDGKIAAVGKNLSDEGALVVDASGQWVTPGIIDLHSHLEVYPSPSVDAHSDGNGMTAANTAEVWAEHSIWPQDPGFVAALAGGVTALQILPGSANLFGGRSVTVKNFPVAPCRI